MSSPIAPNHQKFLDTKAKWASLRFTDTRGKEQHVSVPANEIDETFFKAGKRMDGSSVENWQPIHKSDLQLCPSEFPNAVTEDVFTDDKTAIIRCFVKNPYTNEDYEKDPRSICNRAAAYLKNSGIADIANIGPEPEFYIFDDVRWRTDPGHQSFTVRSSEAAWLSHEADADNSNLGHRPKLKGGYFPVPPVDGLRELRNEICNNMTKCGLHVEVHHHEVGGAGQCEIGFRYADAVTSGDQVQLFKYTVLNTAHEFGMTGTFMPKPLADDNGNGMHMHVTLDKGGTNIFSGDMYGGLSQEALYFIGGIIKHGRALNAFTNSTTNSYRRLVPGFEAPTILTYSANNRSAAIRLPWVHHAKGRRIEIRFPDPACNPYLANAAVLMAGIDGIENQIDPGEPGDADLYAISMAEARRMPSVCGDLNEAVEAIEKDHEFITGKGVMSEAALKSYIEILESDLIIERRTVHPIEFAMYYSV